MVLTRELTEKICSTFQEAALYIEEGSEAMKIDYVEEDECYALCTGEETGEQYRVYFENVDLETAMFYKYVLMEVV